jgi:hypothetical protein
MSPKAPIDHAPTNRQHKDSPTLSFMDQRAPLDEMPSGSFSSSNVHSAIYDFGERTLFIRYLRDGPDAIYQYWDVPAQVWSGLQAASSKGSFINESIAYEYKYALFGRDDFPGRGHDVKNDRIRAFVTRA